MIFRMEVEVNELGDIEDYLGVVGRSINTGIPLGRFDTNAVNALNDKDGQPAGSWIIVDNDTETQ